MSSETKTTPATAPRQPAAENRHGLSGELLFEIFCAVIFLGMIGLVFYNAFLRYVFGGSYPPSEEWARFLFIYITFFGAIEAFYWKKHIVVDMFMDMFSGMSRKCIEILAILLTMGALGLLLDGGITYVLQTIDTNSVATNVNMAFINSTLPIMAFTAILICLRDLIALVRRPASSFVKATEEEKIEQEISKEL
ncbi:TRAP transporter small permease [Desulfovibrio sp.]|uniref:TRAP transporter small permease n=1 Tax=Desulfovibrio sp. TaxID=885 RepID=UPI003AF54256